MAFIIQQGENNCGAFTIAYWKWLKEGRSPDGATAQEEDGNYIKEIYELIKFYSNAPSPSLEDNCNPINMMNLLDIIGNVKTVFHYKVGDTVDRLYQDICDIATEKEQHQQTSQYPIINYFQNNRQIAAGQLPLPGNGAYAILICSVSTGGLHYILVREKTPNSYQMMNPWDGFWKDIRQEQYSGNERINFYTDAEQEELGCTLTSLASGIMIPANATAPPASGQPRTPAIPPKPPK